MPYLHTPDDPGAPYPSSIAARDELPTPRPQATQHLWLPGYFPSNNDLLELARTDGFNAGLRHYERSRGKRQSPVNRPGARMVASIRALAAAHGRKHLHPIPGERWVRLAFFLLGHTRMDSDAWYLAAKHIADGLQDAGIIGRDGADVHSSEGRVVKSAEEAATLLGARDLADYRADYGVPPPAGMLVQVSPWG
jgi:hypothetical protein